MHFLFLFAWKYYFSFNLKDNMAEYKITSRFFFLQHFLNILLYSLLVCVVSNENYCLIFIFILLWVKCFFLWLLSRFCLCLSFLLIHLRECVCVFLCFLNLWFDVCHFVWNFSATITLIIYFVLFCPYSHSCIVMTCKLPLFICSLFLLPLLWLQYSQSIPWNTCWLWFVSLIFLYELKTGMLKAVEL